ncbi:lasso peptide biosynthesis PqqD family chaperone [Streptomyces sp. NBC_00414]|uniref:lasso peptide biosynthesis PqqD family chaperone n=1 Tax=Streptomyces sp. NBC_00414 TaxID=2975739 RepID=UPI002E1E6047
MSPGPRVSEHVSTASTEYGTVLLDERTGHYWQLTPSASFVMARLQEGDGVEEAVAALTHTYDVDEETARRDTLALIDRLRSLGVVTP